MSKIASASALEYARFSLGLQLFQLGGVLFDGALNAGGVERDGFQALLGVEPGIGEERDGVKRIVRLSKHDFGEERILHIMGALQAPVISGDVDNQSPLGDADGGVGVDIAFDVFCDGFLFAGEGGVALSCELMFDCVRGDDLAACFGGWTR